MRPTFSLLGLAAATVTVALAGAGCSSPRSSSTHGTGGSPGTGSSTAASGSTGGGPTTAAGSGVTGSGTGSGGGDAGAPGTPTFVVAGYDLRRVISTDGSTWSHDVSDPPDPMNLDNIGDGIAFGRGICAVVAHSGLRTTTDGVSWTKIGAPLPQQWPGLGGGKVVFTGGFFLIIASSDSYKSTDGVIWQMFSSSAGATHWNGLAYGNGHFVAVGDSNGAGGDRKASEDGETWHDYLEGGPRYGAVAFGNGVFVAVGNGGTLHTTPDGKTWSDHSDPSLGDVGNLVFAGGQFLTCPPSTSKCFTSPDGATWTPHDASSPPDGPITHGLGLYLSISWESNIWTSPDGFAWTKAWSGASGSNALASVGFGALGP